MSRAIRARFRRALYPRCFRTLFTHFQPALREHFPRGLATGHLRRIPARLLRTQSVYFPRFVLPFCGHLPRTLGAQCPWMSGAVSARRSQTFSRTSGALPAHFMGHFLRTLAAICGQVPGAFPTLFLSKRCLYFARTLSGVTSSAPMGDVLHAVCARFPQLLAHIFRGRGWCALPAYFPHTI